MRRQARFVCLAALVALALILGAGAQERPATLVMNGGRVWTGNVKQPWAEAVAVRDEKIIAVGSDKEIAKLAGSGTQKLELRGRFVMPGFNDAHIHFGSVIRLTQVDLNEATNIEQMQQLIAKYAKEHPEAKWIQGYGWQYTSVPGGLPNRAQLDAVVPDRPVYLAAYDGHTGWANSKALEIAGVTKATKYDGFGEIVRDASGEPTGVLKEGAQGLMRRHVPAATREERLAAMRHGMKWISGLGITSIQNAGGDFDDFAMYQELLDKGELLARVSVAISIGPRTTQERIDQVRALKEKYNGPMLRAGAVKIVVDGVIETHTAAMLEPYSDKPGDPGRSSWTPEDLNRVVAMADKAGLQVYIHAIGDRGVRIALDAYENARKLNGARDSRHRIEHIEVVSAADLPRFAQLGVMASMEPIHADPGTADVWSKAVGAQRLKYAFAWRSLEQAGARLVFSSDWAAAISIDPIRGLHSAVNRQTITGQPPGGWVPEQRVSVETALGAYTRAGAFSSFEEKNKGTLEAGKLADVVVLSCDPFKIPSRELHTCRVATTIFNGRLVHDARP